MAKDSERGAAAVEFALVAPILVMLLLGIMEFGRAYNAQVSLTNAAREGVRVMAVSNNQASARTAAKNAVVSLNPTLADSNIAFRSTDGTSGCTADRQMTVTITYSLRTLTGIAGPFTMTGRGVMQCGG
ncbi:TadE/TadG family type IV pilus assembly protein [Arthrobacter rhizosphaerae]|uniref:TadE/TadG family type IV pilus assembly protein n=1 Tax=Arthrobacter rhizosphaerae TaxID=2855490 RepID=UPI001FF2E7F9|nr:TadE family protein [Arthrobacter rhizosphaerae]